MIRELENKDYISVNKLLSIFNYKLDKKSFDNDFLKVLVYEEDFIKGILIYQYLYDRIEIDYIIVDIEYRNLGIATKLLSFMENKYKNIKNITLEVRESNKEAINFYLKNGFKEVTKRRNYYKDEDGILMIKNLGE
ncbi:MAG: GNAT family N-acetyltransferase [Firmicutes bacterium]|nr:GNAT family N-acetyltransferase [Bacillota bacterium]